MISNNKEKRGADEKDEYMIKTDIRTDIDWETYCRFPKVSVLLFSQKKIQKEGNLHEKEGKKEEKGEFFFVLIGLEMEGTYLPSMPEPIIKVKNTVKRKVPSTL